LSEEQGKDQLSRLERWVEIQKAVLETIREAASRTGEMDRLELLVHTRLVFQHLMRTIKAFDEWLQDPSIILLIPRDEMERVFREAVRAFEILVELDISHTSLVKELLEEAAREGKIPIIAPRERDEEGGGSRSTLSM